jgi:hypothetical protein
MKLPPNHSFVIPPPHKVEISSPLLAEKVGQDATDVGFRFPVLVELNADHRIVYSKIVGDVGALLHLLGFIPNESTTIENTKYPAGLTERVFEPYSPHSNKVIDYGE